MRRKVRTLGLCVVGVLALASVMSSAASAKKDPWTAETWGQYKYCPYENEELSDCIYGRTSGGSGGGEFQYGHLRVLLKNPIAIQVGFKGAGESIEVSPAANGGESLEDAIPEPVVKGLNVITPKIQEEANWPER